jgi:hypothetical protein
VIILGKHEDFIFEGAAEVHDKSTKKKEKKIPEKKELHQEHHRKKIQKEHHQHIARYIIIGIIILGIISFISLTYENWNISNIKENKLIQNATTKEITTKSITEDPCESLKGSNKEECMGFTRFTDALIKDDISLCKDNTVCKDEFYSNQAVSDTNPKLCTEINNIKKREDCSKTTVEQLKIINPEEAILQQIISKEHLPEELNIANCKDLEDFEQQKCIENLIIEKSIEEDDVTYCQLSSDPVSCHSFYYKTRAFILGDKELCKEIINLKIKEECLE